MMRTFLIAIAALIYVLSDTRIASSKAHLSRS